MNGVYEEILDERVSQEAKWGEQNHPNGTGGYDASKQASRARDICNDAFARGNGTWCLILMEEVYEAWAESDPQKLRAELIQVAAVAVAWVEAIDRAERDIRRQRAGGK